jgi:hypothetical protein
MALTFSEITPIVVLVVLVSAALPRNRCIFPREAPVDAGAG